jgi:hypothetical protein
LTREKEVHKSEQVDIDGVGDIEQKEERDGDREGRGYDCKCQGDYYRMEIFVVYGAVRLTAAEQRGFNPFSAA